MDYIDLITHNENNLRISFTAVSIDYENLPIKHPSLDKRLCSPLVVKFINSDSIASSLCFKVGYQRTDIVSTGNHGIAKRVAEEFNWKIVGNLEEGPMNKNTFQHNKEITHRYLREICDYALNEKTISKYVNNVFLDLGYSRVTPNELELFDYSTSHLRDIKIEIESPKPKRA